MDCLVHFCCETCALCQEYRELKNRGYDMSIGTKLCSFLSSITLLCPLTLILTINRNIGWEANMERQGQGGSVTVAPAMTPAMTR
jgi:hypothetical protein